MDYLAAPLAQVSQLLALFPSVPGSMQPLISTKNRAMECTMARPLQSDQNGGFKII
jgi:hypothetical protein